MASRSDILEATESGITEIDGDRYVVSNGITRVSADHPLARAHPEWFSPIEGHLSYAVEEMTAEPGRRSRPPQKAPGAKSVQSEAAASDAEQSVTHGITTESIKTS